MLYDYEVIPKTTISIDKNESAVSGFHRLPAPETHNCPLQKAGEGLANGLHPLSQVSSHEVPKVAHTL